MGFKPIDRMMHSKIGCIHDLGHYLAYLGSYKNMYAGMVKREFQGKFKNTALGYFWHLLNPLSQIIIYLVIFTVIFGKNIPNYWVYISTGMFAFSLFSVCVNQGCTSITTNSSLVTKMTFAREILMPVKATSALIALSMSYSILALLMVVTGVGITVNILYVPVIVLSLMVFSTGLGYILSAATVYVRDVANAVGIIMGCLMFTVPLFYMADGFRDTYVGAIWDFHPLYYYINTIHDAFYYGVTPDMMEIAVCVIAAMITFIVGLCIFKKLEPGFAERL